MRHRHAGVSLPELLVAVAVLALLLGAALPNGLALVQRGEIGGTAGRLMGDIQFARHAAVQYRGMTTLCPLPARTGDAACGSDWNRGYRVFVDRNADARLDADHDRLLLVDAPVRGTRVAWRAFRRRDYLQFEASGLTHALNGTFVICGRAGSRDQRRLVINIAGRVRVEQPAAGREPAC